MTINDFRVALTCPLKPGRVFRFVQRTDPESRDIAQRAARGENWAELVCDNAILNQPRPGTRG